MAIFKVNRLEGPRSIRDVEAQPFCHSFDNVIYTLKPNHKTGLALCDSFSVYGPCRQQRTTTIHLELTLGKYTDAVAQYLLKIIPLSFVLA